MQVASASAGARAVGTGAFSSPLFNAPSMHAHLLLQCLMGGPSTGFAACMNVLPGEAASGSGKRHLDGDCGEVGNEVGGEQDEEDNDNDSEEGTGTATARGGGGRASGRGKKARGPGTDAASVKAHREKARRERLNEW
jgi:hypothetical protein